MVDSVRISCEPGGTPAGVWGVLLFAPLSAVCWMRRVIPWRESSTQPTVGWACRATSAAIALGPIAGPPRPAVGSRQAGVAAGPPPGSASAPRARDRPCGDGGPYVVVGVAGTSEGLPVRARRASVSRRRQAHPPGFVRRRQPDEDRGRPRPFPARIPNAVSLQGAVVAASPSPSVPHTFDSVSRVAFLGRGNVSGYGRGAHRLRYSTPRTWCVVGWRGSCATARGGG